jgi:hypothetical protein
LVKLDHRSSKGFRLSEAVRAVLLSYPGLDWYAGFIDRFSGNVNDPKSVDSLKGVVRQIVGQQGSRDGICLEGQVSVRRNARKHAVEGLFLSVKSRSRNIYNFSGPSCRGFTHAVTIGSFSPRDQR